MLVFGSQLAVEVGGSHLYGLVLAEIFGGGFHHRERLWKDFVQRLFDVVKLLFLEFVDLVVEFLLLVGLHVGVGFGLGFQLGDFGHLGGGLVLDVFLEFLCLMSQAVDVEFHDLIVSLECLLEYGL